MRTSRYKQVDVFTSRPFFGNPVAVVLDADGLAEADMQRIAAWTNLSETTFVLPSARASYRLRIFTPRAELPFAGHPTLGSAHAVREAGLVPGDQTALTQECGAGLIPITVAADGTLHLRAPAARLTPFADEQALGRALGCASNRPIVVDVGPRWLVAALDGTEALRRLRPDLAAIEQLSREADLTGVTVYAVDDGTAAGLEVRSFAPLHGVPEDPVCGSGNAAVGAHLRATGGLPPLWGGSYRARQGGALGRAGEILVAVDDASIAVGGSATTVIEGVIRL